MLKQNLACFRDSFMLVILLSTSLQCREVSLQVTHEVVAEYFYKRFGFMTTSSYQQSYLERLMERTIKDIFNVNGQMVWLDIDEHGNRKP